MAKHGIHIRIVLFKFLLISTPVIFASCKTNRSSVQSVIGENDLKEDSSRPSEQGFLVVGDRSCNAFLIGTDIVITALHCVESDRTDPSAFSGFKFRPFASDAPSAEVIGDLLIDSKKDVVAYKLDRTYSKFYRIASVKNGERVTIQAMDVKSRVFLSNSCADLRVNSTTGAVSYSCDTRPGFSGAPVIQNGQAIGVHLGYDSKSNTNFAFDFDFLTNDNSDISKMVGANLEGWGPHIRVPSPHIRIPSADNPLGLSGCGGAVATSVGKGMECGGCIAASTVSAGATAIACAVPCGTTAGSLTVAMGICK